MPRKHKIKWRSSDSENLAKRVKNFNAKITRLSKKHPEIAEFLPERVSVKSLKADISTRADYNKIVKALTGFTTKGAEKIVTGKSGAKTTQWEYRQVQKAVQAENRARKRQQDALDKRPVMIGGKVYKDVRRAAAEKALAPLHLNFQQRSKTGWKNFAKYMQRAIYGQSQLDEKRYFRACVNCWNAILPAAQSIKLQETMRAIGISKCLQAYYNGVDELRPDFVYDSKYSGFGESTFIKVMNAMRKIQNLPDIQEQFESNYMYNKDVKIAPRSKYKVKPRE